MKMTDQLRVLVENEESRRVVARATGIDEAALSRFVNRTSSLNGNSLDKLVEYYRLELTLKTTKEKKKR